MSQSFIRKSFIIFGINSNAIEKMVAVGFNNNLASRMCN